MTKTILITLGFVSNDLFKHTAARLKASLSNKHEIDRIFIAKPYPINEEENIRLNIETAIENGYRIIKKDVDKGAAGDFNETVFSLGIEDNDIIINFDHDIYPVQDGWDDAIIRVFKEPSIDWACLWNEATTTEFMAKPGVDLVVDGVNLKVCSDWMMAGVSAFRGSFLKHTGGLVQPPKYYGGVEEAMWKCINALGTKQVFLKDFSEDQRIKHKYEDPRYRAWKMVHTQRAFQYSFKEWLSIQRPSP